jgi:hypothetical protein
VIARWKGIIEEIHFGGSIMPSSIIENLYLKKPSFRPSKWPRKLKPAKNSKLPKLPENCFEPVGKGGWPPISTWISFFPEESYTSSHPFIPLFLPNNEHEIHFKDLSSFVSLKNDIGEIGASYFETLQVTPMVMAVSR